MVSPETDQNMVNQHEVADSNPNQPNDSQQNKEGSNDNQSGPIEQPRPTQGSSPNLPDPGLPGIQGRGNQGRGQQGQGPRQHGGRGGRHKGRGWQQPKKNTQQPKGSGNGNSQQSGNKGNNSNQNVQPQIDTITILKKMEDLSSSSISHTTQLGSKIESLIEVLTNNMSQKSPIGQQPPQNSIAILENEGSDISPNLTFQTAKDSEEEEVLLSHQEAIVKFFSEHPFHLSLEYIHGFLLEQYTTVWNILSPITVCLRPASLIIQLHCESRLDDYKMLEDDLIIFSGLIKYLQTLPEGTVDMRNFDPLEFYSFINDQYLELREPLVLTTTRLWDISVNNTRASTAKFRAMHGTGGKPKVAFASPVQGGGGQ